MSKSGVIVLTVCVVVLMFACGSSSENPNVLIILIDALRADNLSCYGYNRNTSPSIDSIALTGVKWKICQAQAPWTLPGTSSIFSGLSVQNHGAGRNTGTMTTFGMNPGMPILPELFENAGYRTCGIFNVPLLSEVYGFDRGFDHYSYYPDGDRRAALIVDEFLEWVSGDDDEFMAVLHFFDVHDPYNPPPPFDRMFLPEDTLSLIDWEIDEDGELLHPEYLEHYLAMYDGEIAWVDSELSRLFQNMREMEIADNTIIVVIADHGEEFLEHGWIGHGGTFYQELLRIPLIMTGPGIPSGEIRGETAAQFDLLPTLLALCSIESTVVFDGIDLLSDSSTAEKRGIPSSGLLFSSRMMEMFPVVSILLGNIKYIAFRDEGTLKYAMFDLNTDPQERHSAIPDAFAIEMLDNYIISPPMWEPSEVELDEQSIRELEGLGYL